MCMCMCMYFILFTCFIYILNIFNVMCLICVYVYMACIYVCLDVAFVYVCRYCMFVALYVCMKIYICKHVCVNVVQQLNKCLWFLAHAHSRLNFCTKHNLQLKYKENMFLTCGTFFEYWYGCRPLLILQDPSNYQLYWLLPLLQMSFVFGALSPFFENACMRLLPQTVEHIGLTIHEVRSASLY